MTLIRLIPKILIKYEIDLRNLSSINEKGFDLKNLNMLKIKLNNETVNLETVFKIQIKKSKDINMTLIVEGSNKWFNYIGYNWRDNDLVINGDAGLYLGGKIKSGYIRLNGSCGNFLGIEMTGGLIEIMENSGDFVGSASFGKKIGMNGGRIKIFGSAGDYLGSSMRRGFIFVKKNVGKYCASNLIAGTVIIGKEIGEKYGFGMKRGTLILLKKPKHNYPYFSSCGYQELNFFRLLREFIFPGDEKKKFQNFEKFIGDRNNFGLAELLVLIKN